jgi:hypothetical protein
VTDKERLERVRADAADRKRRMDELLKRVREAVDQMRKGIITPDQAGEIMGKSIDDLKRINDEGPLGGSDPDKP